LPAAAADATPAPPGAGFGAEWGGVAVRPPAANAFILPATEPTWSPCRWWKLLMVDAADAASEAETEVGSLYAEDAVWRAARSWAQVVPAVDGAVPGCRGCAVVRAGVDGLMPNPGTDIPLDERLLMADLLR